MPQCCMSKTDKANVEKLREAVKDELTPYYDTDFNLLRWLQGHGNNFDTAIPKLKNHLHFRRSKWDLDHVADKARNHPIHAYWKNGLTGAAVKTPNVIVNVEQTGRNDYWGMLQTYSSIEIMEARVYDLEMMLRRVMQMEAETGQQASILYFMDLAELKYDNHLISLVTGALSAISAFMSEHYVEMIHTFVIVNAPSFISSVWTVANPLLPERTRKKVRILGSNWKSEVQKIAIAEVLPVFWNDDKVQVFKAELAMAEAVNPQKYSKEKMVGNLKSLSVRPGKTGSIDIKANKGSVIRWTINANGNFGFTVLYVEEKCSHDPRSAINIYPTFTKVPGPTMVPIKDEVYCEKNGIYKIWFNNGHAWWHTLQIEYLLEVKYGDG